MTKSIIEPPLTLHFQDLTADEFLRVADHVRGLHLDPNFPVRYKIGEPRPFS